MSLAAREPVNEWVALGGSGIHGRGGFARRAIPAGTPVIEYVGERIGKAESARRCEAENPYIFILDETWDLDGAVAWNPARFLNHSCGPNCEAQREGHRLLIVAKRPIEAGEELTFNYGYGLDSWRDYPCACGANNCLGFIVGEEHWPAVREELKGRFVAVATAAR